MTDTEFRALVRQMREIQRRYFARRSAGDLEAARVLEKAVDRELAQKPLFATEATDKR